MHSTEPLAPPKYFRRMGASISIHGRGFETSAPKDRLPPPKRGTKRGTIKGWSSHSRGRLRRALLSLQPPAGFSEWAVTLTVPGPVVTPERYKRMWWVFSRMLVKKGWSAIWRAEVQARGALHWHAVVHLPPSAESGEIVQLWHHLLERPEPIQHRAKPTDDNPDPDVVEYDCRMEIPGASRYSARVDPSDGSDKWWRYLCDHTSKAKQEQIGEGIGRHWGIVGRKRYTFVRPELERLDDSAFYRVLRALQRLATPVCKCPPAPFGRKLSRRMKRGHEGRSVWFTSPDIVRRLLSWVVAPLPA